MELCKPTLLESVWDVKQNVGGNMSDTEKTGTWAASGMLIGAGVGLATGGPVGAIFGGLAGAVAGDTLEEESKKGRHS
jgi:outer membrane lipoprotein SlyB